MKKILFSLLLVAVVSAGANAQQREGKHGMKKKHRHGMAMQKLNLSEDQKAKLKTINADFKSQMQTLNKQDQLTVKDWKAKKATLRTEHKSKIEALLTKEQKDQLAKMKENRKMKGEKMGEKRMEMMKQHLGLSETQSAKIKELNSSFREKAKAIHDNQSLAKDQKKEQLTALRKENHEKMKSILTAEQLKKAEDMKKMRHERQDKKTVK